MPRAASVWLDVLPSMAEFRRELRRELEDPIRQSAARAGDQAGEGLMAGMKGKMAAGAVAAGAAVGALVVQGLQEAMAKQQATATLKAQLGLSAKDAQKAGKAAGSLYGNAVTGSIEEGAQAVRAIMAAGLAPEKATTRQLSAIATKVQDVSTLFEVDLGQTANAVGQIMKTGLAKNSSEALDTITRGFQTMGPRADDLMDTFNEYSTIFRALGLDVKTTTGLISQGMKAGARDTDVVADALKEFQIRATDGSTASAEGFKILGLNAKDMTAQIAQGGKGATSGLGSVLERLKAMKDPVDRNAAAVALFGTKAEDMGEALYALDLDTAASGLGKVGGAAKRAGDDLRNTAGVQFEQFKRKALMAIGDGVGRYALPALMKLGVFLVNDVLPPVRTVGGVLLRALVPAVLAVGSAVSGTLRWLREYGAWLAPLGVVVGGLTLMLTANAIATGAVTAAFSLYRGAILAWTAVQRTAIAIQTAWNTVMALNPIGLVVIALVALGAALVVAYQKSETFRGIVQGAWEGIKTAALWVWNNALKPAIDGLVAGWKMVSAGAVWLWGILQPVFSAIGTGLKILATIWAVIMFGPMYLGVKVLGAVFGWLWTNAISPVIGFIVGGFKLWWAGVKIYFNFVKAAFTAVGNAALWLWRNAISPVIGWIVGGFKLWWAGVKLYFNFVKAAFRAVGDAAKWLWNKAISPVFNWIRDKATWLWEKALKPAFDWMKKGIKAVGRSFEDAKDFIGRAWSKIEGLAKKPVRFIINTVYNKGIVPVWNKVAKAFGAPEIKEMNIKGWATGGVLPGYTPGRDPHTFYSRTGGALKLSGGEAIMRPEFTRAVGSSFVHSMNRIATSSGAAGVRKALAPALGGQPQQAYASGGIFSWIGKKASGAGSAIWDTVKKGAAWLKDGLEASARAGVKHVVDPLLANFPGADTRLGKMIRRIPTRMIDALFGYSKKADDKGAGGIGGKGYQAALRWARTQHGKEYQWGGNGNPSWDCSGFLSAIESVIRGQKPHRRWSTFAFSGKTAPPGWVRGKRSPFQIGITNSGVGHTAGTLNRVNVESRGGDGVVVGPRARSYKDRMFTDWYGFTGKGYASGGRPRPGEWATVGERGPELLRFGGPSEVFDNRTSARIAAADEAYQAGRRAGAGVVEGMAATLPRLGAAAPAAPGSPQGVLPVSATLSAPHTGGLQPGQRVRLVVGDREMDAYVDDRVDAGLSQVRQRARAGVAQRR